MREIVGRKEEIELLERLYASKQAEFLAIYVSFSRPLRRSVRS